MNKRDLIRKHVKKDIWNLMRQTYKMGGEKPQSKMQQEFLDSAVEYVVDKFADSMKLDKLQKAFNCDVNEVLPLYDQEYGDVDGTTRPQ